MMMGSDAGEKVEYTLKRRRSRDFWANGEGGTTTHLHEGSLDLSIGASSLTEPSSSNSINLIHEDDTWLVLSRVRKHLSDHSRRFSDVFIDNLHVSYTRNVIAGRALQLRRQL